MADLNSMSRQELMTLRADIDRAIATAGERDKRNALKAAEDAAREHGMSLADLTSLLAEGGGAGRGRGARASKAPREVRFRNPEDHTQTWSGRGRRPQWYHDAEAAGRAIEDLKAS